MRRYAGRLAILFFLVLTVTGIFLMFHYRPVIEYAYLDMKSLQFGVTFGPLLRNMHRWGAYALVILTMLHVLQVSPVGSFKSLRELNWVVGAILLVLTVLMFFTGHALPCGKASVRLMSLFGGPDLLSLYVLHCVVIPVAVSALVIVSLRKEAGSKADLPLKSGLGLLILLTVCSILFDAPLDGPASLNPRAIGAAVAALMIVGLILAKRSSTKAMPALWVVFSVVFVWALYDGLVVKQPWRYYQREFNRWELAGLQAEYEKARQVLEAVDAAKDRLPDPVTDESQLSLRRIRLKIEEAEIGMEREGEAWLPELQKWRRAEEKFLEPVTKLEREMDAIRSGKPGIWQKADRCELCHVAINRAGLEGEMNPFKTHPFRAEILAKHPPEKFGCTTCHGGQGLATRIEGRPFGPGDFAHGFDPESREPLLRGGFVRSSCKKCHQGQ